MGESSEEKRWKRMDKQIRGSRRRGKIGREKSNKKKE